MNDRARRQQRLLAVRELQADLAAAHLRTLRSQQDELRQDLARWQGMMHVDTHRVVAKPGEWLLACAEGEIAAVRSQTVADQIEAQQTLIDAQAAEERERRIAREQMRRLCDHTANTARVLEDRTVQARLDDVFSAARLRRLSAAIDR